MRTQAEVDRVLALVAEGLNDCQVARITGIPRRTSLDWRIGRRPDFPRRASLSDGPPHSGSNEQKVYAYLLGLYLGDGHIVRAGRTYRLRVTLDGLYPNVVEECRSAMEALLPNRARIDSTPSRAVVVNSFSNAWPALLPQHGPGPKHKRCVELEPWQARISDRNPEFLIRGLIHSDGSRHINRVRHGEKTYAYPRYEFSNRSDDIRAIFCEHLDLLAIPWRTTNRWTISIARNAGVARLDEFVGPKR